MNHTLAGPERHWQIELERRAEEVVIHKRATQPSAIPQSQLLGMALCCAVIGALAAAALILSLQ